MNFIEAVSTVLKKSFVFSGRASRSEYWYWVLFCMVVGIFLSVLDVVFNTIVADVGLIGLGFNLVTLIPYVAVGVRRLHDINRNGWWLLIPLTIIGIIPLLIWMCKKGDEGENRFGADPLES